MQEVCYCGRRGAVEDREPVWGDGHSEALRCPQCGHRDPLSYLDDDLRRQVFEEAERRLLQRLAERTQRGRGSDKVA